VSIERQRWARWALLVVGSLQPADKRAIQAEWIRRNQSGLKSRSRKPQRKSRCLRFPEWDTGRRFDTVAAQRRYARNPRPQWYHLVGVGLEMAFPRSQWTASDWYLGDAVGLDLDPFA
jgi:hypothetical protein